MGRREGETVEVDVGRDNPSVTVHIYQYGTSTRSGMSQSRDTPVTYSREEAVQIRSIVGDASVPLVCPRCSGQLRIGYPIAAGGTVHPVWEVRCQKCHRAAYATEVAEGHRPSSGQLDEPDPG